MVRLPDEILSYIFCLAVSSSAYARKGRFTIFLPLYVSQVCREWRYTALGCGELWSYLNMEYESGKYGSDDRQRRYRDASAEIFFLWLKRTNSVVLNFRFTCNRIAPRSTVEAIIGGEFEENQSVQKRAILPSEYAI